MGRKTQNKKLRTGGNKNLPFDELLQQLQQEGFIIDANDYVEFSAIYNSLQPETPEQLKYYLAPIVCRNEEEQRKFYQLFDSFVQQKAVEEEPPEVKPNRWIRLVLATVIIGVAVIYFIPGKKKITIPPLAASICTASGNAKEDISFSTYCNYDKQQDTAYSIADWNFGDGTQNITGHTVVHNFKKKGLYRVSLSVKRTSDNVLIKKDTLVSICEAAVELTDNSQQPLYAGDSFHIKAGLIDSSAKRKECYWVVSNTDSLTQDTILNINNALDWQAPSPANYNIAFYYANGCKGAELNFNVNKKDPYSSTITPTGSPISNELSVNPVYIISLLGACLAFILLAWYYFRKQKKAIDANRPLPAADPEFKGMDAPFEIPYQPKDQHIQHLLDLSKISYNLSRRTEAEIPFLNIHRTIRDSVKNAGLVSPAYSNRQKPREYLILIDESISNNQQTFLFRYLINSFLRDNVLIDLYFFYKKPGSFYRDNSTTPVNFQRLKDDHYGASLIIMGNGYNMISASKPGIEPGLRSSFEFWDKRILVSPVPMADWSINEKILSGFFNMVPADISGWISLAQFITDDVSTAIIRQDEWNTYSAKFIKAEDITSLQNYLADDDLLEWLCATAVHHNVRWEIVVAMGHAILTLRNALHKLNYTNLLKLARIKWMEEGIFPAALRLDMLKKLSVPGELLARKTMLNLLSESDNRIDETSFTNEEKQVQQYTDSFVLYSNDRDVNKVYKAGADKFVQLWANNQVVDIALAAYLSKDSGNWATPVNSIAGSNINMQQYIQEQEQAAEEKNNRQYRRYKRLAFMSATAAMLCLLAVIGIYNFKKQIVSGKLNDVLELVKSQSPAEISITFNLANNACLKQRAGTDSTVYLYYDNDTTAAIIKAGNLLNIYTDSIIRLTIPRVKLDSTKSRPLITLRFNASIDKDIILPSTTINNSAYSIDIKCQTDLQVPVTICYRDSNSLKLVDVIRNGLPANLKSMQQKRVFGDTNAISVFYFSDAQYNNALLAATSVENSTGITVVPQKISTGKDSSILIYIDHIWQQPCVTLGIKSLPLYLDEIWQGTTNNRLVNINLAKKTIYYSTGDKKTYGTYLINEICMPSVGTYRIMTIGKGSNVFFIRNITASSMELSFCQEQINVLDEARKLKDDACGPFNKMQLYYPNDRSKIYLPVQAVSLQNSEAAKIRAIVDSADLVSKQGKELKPTTTIYENKTFLRPLIENVVTQYLFKNKLFYDIGNDDWLDIDKPNPFERNYITIEKTIRNPRIPDCDRVFFSLKEALAVNPMIICALNLENQNLTSVPKEIYNFKNLQRLYIKNNKIPEAEIQLLKDAFPKADIQYTVVTVENKFIRLSRLVVIAESQVGVTENPPGTNKGPEVEKYLASVGLSPGYSWNSAFVYWCYAQLGESNPLPKSPGVSDMWNKLSTKLLSKDALENPGLIIPGNVFFIDNGNGTGHCGIVVNVNGDTIETIEGNSNITGSADGIAVVKRTRKISSVNKGFSHFLEVPRAMSN